MNKSDIKDFVLKYTNYINYKSPFKCPSCGVNLETVKKHVSGEYCAIMIHTTECEYNKFNDDPNDYIRYKAEGKELEFLKKHAEKGFENIP